MTREGFGLEPFASVIETVGEKFERGQPRKLLTRRAADVGDARSNDPIAGGRSNAVASDNLALVPGDPDQADPGLEPLKPARHVILVIAANLNAQRCVVVAAPNRSRVAASSSSAKASVEAS